MEPLKSRKMPLVLLIVLLVAVISLMWGLRRCSYRTGFEPMMSEESEGDTLKIALAYSPMTYYRYSDTLGGLSYDMLRIMGRDLSVPLMFYPVSTISDGLDALEKGRYDILAAVPADGKLRQRFQTVEDVYLDRQVLVQRRGRDGVVKVKSSLDLAGDTVHVAMDSPSVCRLAKLSREIGAPIIVVSHNDVSEESLFRKVASGECEYAMVNELTAQRLSPDYPEMSFDTPVNFTQFQTWLVNPTDTLLFQKVNSWLDTFKPTPEYRNLLEKYQSPRTERQ